jgi:soluble lytic murein transglycosylase-like protein
MGILTSYIGNQMGNNPSSSGDFLANYFGQQLANNNQQPQQANAIPKTTTISTDESGDTTVTQKQTISKEQKDAAQQQQQPAPFVPQSYQNAVAAQQQQALQNPQASAPIQQPPLPQAGPVAPQAPQAPQAQPYQPPQAPQGVFGRMVQAESGGQQTGPNGQILTSPKGAVGIAQIMPSTAAQPGYGIAPATPQELATPQGNMLFGQRYFEGMYNKFGQDPEKAAAAYNAGPGTIEKAMAQADQQGGSWKDYVPKETQDYLTKVMPEGEKTRKKIEPLIAGTAGSDIGMTPEEQAIHHIVLNSGDVNALGMGTYAGDHLISKEGGTKYAYADAHADALEQNRKDQQAGKKFQEAFTDPTGRGGMEYIRAMNKEGEEGSYLKAYLFQRLGLHDLAKNEQQKLGAGDQYAQVMIPGKNGEPAKPAWVKFNGQGAPVKGWNTDGELSGNELLNTIGMKGVEQHTQAYQDRTTKELYFLQTTPQGPRMVSSNGKVYSGPTSNLMAYGIGADVERKNTEQLQSLRNRLLNEPKITAAKKLAEFNAENGTNYTYDQVINAQPAMTGVGGQVPVTGGQPQATPQQPGAVQQSVAGQTGGTMPQGGPVAPQAQPQPQPQAQPQQGPAVPGQAPAAVQASAQPQATVGAGYQPKIIEVPTQPNPGEPPAAFKARRDQIVKANEKITAQETQKMYGAESMYNVAKEINDTLPKSTGSYIGAKVDQLAGAFGVSTEGAQAIAQLKVLGNRILMNVPRFEGPQSDRDTQVYKDAAGSLADDTVPIETRIAAFKTIQDINKKYAPNLDWDFTEKKEGKGGIKIISREKI